jgi:hypothetical protein
MGIVKVAVAVLMPSVAETVYVPGGLTGARAHVVKLPYDASAVTFFHDAPSKYM